MSTDELNQIKEQLKQELRQELRQEIEREVSSSRTCKPWYGVSKHIDSKIQNLNKFDSKQIYHIGTAVNTIIRHKLGYKNVVDLKVEHVQQAKEIAEQVISILVKEPNQ